jgi:hypothetical protein
VHKKAGQLQVVKKSFDPTNGTYHIKVNSYHCKLVSNNEEVIIFEADHINGGIAEFLRKDEQECKTQSKQKKAC